jgi:outer membrane protein assembly factor BamD (BamD/ComL family)
MARLLVLVTCAAAFGLLSSCAAPKPFTTEGLSVEEMFQRAQDAADRGDYKQAIDYYTAVPEKFPDDKAHQVWATYEMAFIYHKMGKSEEALPLVNQILDRYTKEGDSLPPAPLILAQKLKTRVEAAIEKTPPKKP